MNEARLIASQTRAVLALAVVLFLTSPVSGEVNLREGCSVQFVSVNEGREILTREGDFIRQLSAFDRASRMKTDRSVSKDEFLKFVRGNVLEWSEPEKARIEAAIAKIRPALETRPLTFPKIVYLIKTTGAEEGKAFYTRDTAIIFPEPQLVATSGEPIEKTIAHELFHIWSRKNPALREKLYEAIGFTKTQEIAFPAHLKDRKITNPDAPRNDHSIRLRFKDREVSGIPILFSSAENYDTKRGGEFFDYLQFKFLLRPTNELAGPKEVAGFFEQVGRNTDYIIHPEEILADNFALLVMERRDVPSPEILRRIEKILNNK